MAPQIEDSLPRCSALNFGWDRPTCIVRCGALFIDAEYVSAAACFFLLCTRVVQQRSSGALYKSKVLPNSVC